jgi:tetratricopeptide (TPR) repeat protein
MHNSPWSIRLFVFIKNDKLIETAFTIFAITICWFSISLSQNRDELFIKGNQAYRAEDYDTALSFYNEILSQGFETSDLYFNMGNCYFRMEQIGQAILYYEKARKLDPNDPDINYNLELANLKVVDRIESPPRFFLFNWWDSLKLKFSLINLVYLLIFLFFLSIFSLIVWLFSRSNRLRSFLISITVVSGLLFLLWCYIFFIRVNEIKNRVQAIIIVPSVTVVSAPDENSTDMFILHEGVKVDLEEQSNEWVNISLVDGKTGWVKSNVLGII